MTLSLVRTLSICISCASTTSDIFSYYFLIIDFLLVITFLLLIMIMIYSLTHKLTNKQTNTHHFSFPLFHQPALRSTSDFKEALGSSFALDAPVQLVILFGYFLSLISFIIIIYVYWNSRQTHLFFWDRPL